MKKNLWIFIFLLPTVILFLLIYAIPLGMVTVTSLFDYRVFPNRFNFVGLGNYIQLFTQDAGFRIGFKNTIIWILIHCILHVGLGVSLALVLYKKPKGWKFVRTIYMIPNIISNAAIAMIFINFYNPVYGVVNSFLRIIGKASLERNWLFETETAFPAITMIWFIFAGYTTILVLAQALTLDESILEAARIDGASNFQVDLFVVLPLLKKIIGTTMIMAATYMLQLFDLIYITTKGGPGTTTTNLPLILYRTALGENNYGYANTVGVIIIILGIICMTIINKLFRVNENDY